MTPHSRRFSSDARRLRRRIERRDERLSTDVGHSGEGRGRDVTEATFDHAATPAHHRQDADGGALFERRTAVTDDDAVRAGDAGGLRDMVFGFFSRRKNRVKPEERGDPAPSDDPVRQVLAVPRGAARLDAFEQTLRELGKDTYGHKSVALAFHRELTSMSTEAGLDLSLLGNRVDACADGLVDAGELERAGEILMAAGRKERAAALFSEAGAVDRLDEASFSLALDAGVGTLDAHLAVERTQNLLQVSRRGDALSLLAEAQKRFPRSHEVSSVARTIIARLPQKNRLFLSSERGSAVIDTRWPIVLGRGEDTALPLSSPVLSREHAELRHEGSALVLAARTPRARLVVDGRPAAEQTLARAGALSLDGIGFAYRVDDAALVLTLTDASSPRVLAVPFSTTVALEEPIAATFRFDPLGRALAVPDGALAVNGEILHAPMLLFVDDELTSRGRHARVARG
jgi:hypothetical protein